MNTYLNKLLKGSSVAAAALMLSACVGAGGGLGYDMQRYQYTAIGSAAGALAGGVLGHQMDDEKGRYYGAAAGALLGGVIGNNIDQTRAYNGAVQPYNRAPQTQPQTQVYPQQQAYPQQQGYSYSPPPQPQPYY